MTTALIFAAHPDDEVLGCGGTIARLTSEGWAVHVVIVAEGATSRSDVRDISKQHGELAVLAKSAKDSNEILGVTSLKLCSLPDNRLDSLDLLDVVKIVEREIDIHQPELVFTHHAGDVNIDHKILHDAVVTACRPQPNHPVKLLLFYEVASSTEWRPASSGVYFTPNYYYDISQYLEKKVTALAVYQSELKKFPHPRSIEAIQHLAKWRGATIGLNAAEAFMLGRVII